MRESKKSGRMRALNEATGIALWASAAFLLIMLLSYDIKAPAQNLMGIWGSYLAHAFYYFFGYASFVLVALIFRTGYTFFMARRVIYGEYLYERIIRHLSALMLLLSAAALLSMRLAESTQLPAAAGGEIGRIIATNMSGIFGVFGSVSILFILFLISFGLLTGLSWLLTLEQIGALCLSVAGKLSLFRADPTGREQAPVIRKISKSSRWFGKNIIKKKPSLKRHPGRVEPHLTFMPGQNHSSIKKEDPRLGEANAAGQQEKSGINKQALAQTQPKTAFSGISRILKNLSKNPPKITTKNKTDLLSSGQQAKTGQATQNMRLPTQNCFEPLPANAHPADEQDYEKLQQQLVEKLKDFGIDVQPVGYSTGPVVTLFELLPAAGMKASRISNLATDLARSLAVDSIRVLEIMRGKSSIGVEIPNVRRRIVSLHEVLTSPTFARFKEPLPLALGKDTEGQPVVTGLAEMPHLLVAGTTGSGKSVGINAMLMSLLYRYGPDMLRLILVDPKMLELTGYNGIPHLLVPVITDMREASKAINWCVKEMDDRYRMMTERGARNIVSYNRLVKQENKDSDTMPYLVVIIDEYADMIMTNKKIEKEIVRIAQKARAAGIHLILATQRPSVDVITGLIKANIPARISFKVSARVDSRTVLDQNGAEQLLGMGDMLYISTGSSIPLRVHGQFVKDKEVQAVVDHWKKQGQPEYREDVLTTTAGSIEAVNGDDEEDELYAEALAFVRSHNRVSISSVQRQFKIGYNRAARIIDLMEKNGVVSEMDSNGKRSLLS